MCVPGCREAVHTELSRRGFFKGAVASTSFVAVAATPSHAQRGFSRVVDLTHTLSPEFPAFFAPAIAIEKRYTLKKDGANVNWWRLPEHAGTHIDAPFHYSDSGATLEAISVDRLVVPLVVVDVSAKAARNPDYAMTRGDVADWETMNGRLPDGCCVAMNSGWSNYAADVTKFTGKDSGGTMHFPGVDPATAEWLLKERQVVGLAVDTLSLDCGPSRDFKTHTIWLPAGRWGIENIANLDQVPASGATLIVGAPKVKGATGGPARVFALV